ncbi:MAG: bifunctional diguanylate cyclase/phosphodiesterase [Pseudomonadota bacterium]
MGALLTLLSLMQTTFAYAQSAAIDRNSTDYQDGGLPAATESGLPLLYIGVVIILLLTAIASRQMWQARQWRQKLQHSEAQLAQKAQQLNDLASVDQLTGTSNRKAITTFLSDFQKLPHADGEFIALAILDIDYFQRINDAFGYFAGDAVLKEVASRIDNELRDEDRVGRTNANHFAIVLCNLIAPKTAESIIHRIQNAIAEPITFNDIDINVTCSVGAAVQEVATLDLAELFKLSEQALLQAKHNKRGSIFLFSEHAQYALSRQRQIINLLRERDFNELFQLAYQPIVSINDRSIVGCECLLRWIADAPPDLDTTELMPILEMYGDIHAVGEWVLETSFQQLTQWHSQLNCPGLFVSINVSAIQLEDNTFAEKIVTLAEKHSVSPRDISLELTETVAIKHMESGRKQLALLRNLGFGISLDDFGTGYSSLQYLKSMPASTIKIDQTFVREMNADKRDAAIVHSAINIARALGLSVVAEGIDNAEQHNLLKTAGCDYGQGYHYAKPLDHSEFEQAISQQHKLQLSG